LRTSFRAPMRASDSLSRDSTAEMSMVCGIYTELYCKNEYYSSNQI
jgi:hypothetical protein